MARPRITLIDHYDSFAHNLARYARISGADVTVLSYDDIMQFRSNDCDGVILSPGPCAPNDMSHSLDLVRSLNGTLPILGVCLGHQILAQAYGGKTIRCSAPMHGQDCDVYITAPCPIFDDLGNVIKAGRYHSLCADISHAQPLQQVAICGDITMAFMHKTAPIYGVQFHPESLLTPDGLKIIQNFISAC